MASAPAPETSSGQIRQKLSGHADEHMGKKENKKARGEREGCGAHYLAGVLGSLCAELLAVWQHGLLSSRGRGPF